MRTKSITKPKVSLITLGCSKNLFDSEELFTQLKAQQYQVVHEDYSDQNNVVVINTCGFIEAAREESVNTILEFAQMRTAGQIDKLLVTGCLSARFKDELQTEIPEVDAWFGTNELPRILKTLKADYKKELVGERLLSTPGHYAYFKIAEGCDRPCAFCSIPIMRGKHRSTPIEELVVAAKGLARRGVKELILIAQDLTFYGLDIYGKRRLDYLIDALADVEGIEWIRLQYAYPAGFPTEILEAIKRNPNVCRYLDMPLQHHSDVVLRQMRRGITAAKTEALLDTIRQAVPNIALRTTLIAGHPGETQAEFEKMYNFVEKQAFDRLGIFTYSHEPGTHAADTLHDHVPEDEKNRRAKAIMQLQEGISERKNQLKVGNIYKVMVDRHEGGQFIGRTEADSPEVDNEVIINNNGLLLTPGHFVQVAITHAEPFDLVGTAVQ